MENERKTYICIQTCLIIRMRGCDIAVKEGDIFEEQEDCYTNTVDGQIRIRLPKGLVEIAPIFKLKEEPPVKKLIQNVCLN